MMRFVAVCLVVGASAAKYEGPFSRGFIPSTKGKNTVTEVTEVVMLTDDDRYNAPMAIDWSEKGATTPVKDQHHCGSCWAFATTEGVESAYFMQTGHLPPPLSTEQLVDCDDGDHGCDGGDILTGMEYLMDNKLAGGLDSAADYPDTSSQEGSTQKCTWHHDVNVKVTGYKWAIPPCKAGACDEQNEKDLAAVVAKSGPVSICVNANDGWDNYEGGDILKGECAHDAESLNHCVQLVGYDMSASPPYWKVRNSWGPDYGEKGFIRLPFGENACGVASWPLVATVTAPSNATLIDTPPAPMPVNATRSMYV